MVAARPAPGVDDGRRQADDRLEVLRRAGRIDDDEEVLAGHVLEFADEQLAAAGRAAPVDQPGAVAGPEGPQAVEVGLGGLVPQAAALHAVAARVGPAQVLRSPSRDSLPARGRTSSRTAGADRHAPADQAEGVSVEAASGAKSYQPRRRGHDLGADVEAGPGGSRRGTSPARARPRSSTRTPRKARPGDEETRRTTWPTMPATTCSSGTRWTRSRLSPRPTVTGAPSSTAARIDASRETRLIFLAMPTANRT